MEMVDNYMPKLTIAIPNYNGCDNLERCIESCKTVQIPKSDYEILIVDNKSTDNSINIVNEMQKNLQIYALSKMRKISAEYKIGTFVLKKLKVNI